MEPDLREAVLRALEEAADDPEIVTAADTLAVIESHVALMGGGKTYWLTLAISEKELAERMGCSVESVETADYIGAIRDFGEVVKIQEVED